MNQDKNNNRVISIDFESNDEPAFLIRITPDDNVNILDGIQRITKQARKNCIVTWLRYQKANPEGTTSCRTFKFKGRGQQNTPVCDVETFLTIIMNLPGKMAQAYRKKFASILISVLGGDQNLHGIIDANAASTSEVAQLFQRAVQSKRFTTDEIRDAEWFEHRLQLSKPAHRLMSANTNKWFEIQTSIENCKAVYNKTPKVLRDEFGLDKNKVKDHYPMQQLLVSTAFLGAVKGIGNSTKELKRIGKLFSNLSEGLGFHDEIPQILAPITNDSVITNK